MKVTVELTISDLIEIVRNMRAFEKAQQGGMRFEEILKSVFTPYRGFNNVKTSRS